jgi:hypothetical protein
MSLINTMLPTMSSAMANNLPSVLKAQATSGQNSQVMQQVSSGQAAIVSLSTNTNEKKRVSSYGDTRQTDPSFATEEAKEKVDEKKENERKTAGAAVDVSA